MYVKNDVVMGHPVGGQGVYMDSLTHLPRNALRDFFNNVSEDIWDVKPNNGFSG